MFIGITKNPRSKDTAKIMLWFTKTTNNLEPHLLTKKSRRMTEETSTNPCILPVSEITWSNTQEQKQTDVQADP